MFSNDIGTRAIAAVFSVAISAVFFASAIIIPGSPGLVA